MAVVTGTPSTSIVAQTAVSDPGQPITKDESKATVQPIVDDLATIKSGNHRKPRRPRTPLTAANHTIDTSQGDSFQLAAVGSGGPYTITLQRTSSPVPDEGEIIRLYTDYNYGASGDAWIVKEEGASGNIAKFVAKPSTDLMAASAEFEFYNGHWRLGLNTGWDTSALMGVHPEAGA